MILALMLAPITAILAYMFIYQIRRNQSDIEKLRMTESKLQEAENKVSELTSETQSLSKSVKEYQKKAELLSPWFGVDEDEQRVLFAIGLTPRWSYIEEMESEIIKQYIDRDGATLYVKNRLKELLKNPEISSRIKQVNDDIFKKD